MAKLFYNENDIRSIVNEAIGEMALNRMGAKPSAATNGASASPAVKDNPRAISPSCRYACYEDENGNFVLNLQLICIWAQHRTKLLNEWNSKYSNIFSVTSSMANASDDDGKNAPLDIKVIPGKEAEFEQIVPSLVNDVVSQSGQGGGFYKHDAAQTFEKSIIGRINEAPTKDDMEKAESRKIDNFQSLLSRLNDPAVLKQIGLIGGSVTINPSASLIAQGNAAGWRLSSRNQIEVYMQLPNATFVTNEWTWENVFNRKVIDRSQFALVMKPKNNKIKDISSWNRAAAYFGYKDKSNPNKQAYDVFRELKKAKKLSQSQTFAVMALANIYNPQSPDFIQQKVFDVSNTQLISGMPDVWNEQVGYADNLKGLPNQKAMDLDVQMAQDNGTDYQPTQVVPRSLDEITEIINIFRAICARDCGTAPNQVNGGLGDQIAHYAEFYARHFIIPNKNIVKGPCQDAVAIGLGLALAATYGFNVQSYSSRMSQLLHTTSKDRDLNFAMGVCFKEYEDIVGEINTELLKASHKMVKAGQKTAKTQPMQQVVEEDAMSSESLPQPMNFEQFSEVLGLNDMEQIPTEYEDAETAPSQEQMMESFFRMLDKIEIL